MGNTKRYVICGASREKLDVESIADAFRTREDHVAFSTRLSASGRSWIFIAAVESISMSADDGIEWLKSRTIDLSVTRHDVDMPEVSYLRVEPGEGILHETYRLETRETVSRDPRLTS